MHYRRKQTKTKPKSKSRRSRNKKGGFDLFGLLPSAPVPAAPAGQAPVPEEKDSLISSIISFFGSKEAAPATTVAGGRRKKTKTKTKKYKK
jgi:hypothetical protein